MKQKISTNMSNKGLQSKILSYLSEMSLIETGWIHKGEILRKTWLYDDGRKSYMPSYVDRELRLMEENSLIAVKPDENGKSIYYKYIPEKLRTLYLHPEERTNDKLFKS